MEPWQRALDTLRSPGEGRQVADGVQVVVFVGDEGDRTGRQGSGDRAGITAPLAQRGGRTVAAETRQSAEEAMAELRKLRAEVAELRRANEILTTASAFFAARLDPARR